jgi:hypothetical protein
MRLRALLNFSGGRESVKKTLKLIQQRPEEIEIEVDFPVYSEQYVDGDGWSTTIYRRTEHDGTQYSITANRDGYEIEIGRTSFDSRNSLDYMLGRGEYASSAEAFEKARAAAEVYLARFRAGAAPNTSGTSHE